MKKVIVLLALALASCLANAKVHKGIIYGAAAGVVNDAKAVSFPVRHPRKSSKALAHAGKKAAKGTKSAVRAVAGF